METQFIDFSVPDPNKEYYYSTYGKTTGFTLSMKLTLMVNTGAIVMNMIKQIMVNNPEEISKQNSQGWNCLMLAAYHSTTYSSIECVKLFIDSDINKNTLNVKNKDAMSALSLACCGSRLDGFLHTEFSYECIELLLKAGCDVNVSNEYGYHLLFYISEQSRHKDYINCIKLLLDYEFNIGACENYTPLMVVFMYSSGKNMVDACKLLIEHGADVNYVYNDSGCLQMTPLMVLCEGCHNKWQLDCLKIIINRVTNVDFVDECTNRTALIIAAENIRATTEPEFIEILANASSNIDFKDSNGHTALIILCKSIGVDTSKYVDIFIKAGANVNICNNKENTALMMHCKYTHFTDSCINTLVMLIKKSNDITATNFKNKTAHDYFKCNRTHTNIINDQLEELLTGDHSIPVNVKSARNFVI